ncbi:MAG: prepilin-type N-terminal cleavage/methylation domain-containing protein [Planctomycetota bacterium]
MSTKSLRPAAPKRDGFTLVELLIVISIIAILSALVITGLGSATEARNQTESIATIKMLKQALGDYQTDHPILPGQGTKPDPEANMFPKLWTALMADPPKGGRNAPYLENVAKDKIVVEDEESEEGYRPASQEEIDDVETEKFLLDPWGKPYVYRCNRGFKKQGWMRDKKFDLYSLGENGNDDTTDPPTDDDENDDVH